MELGAEERLGLVANAFVSAVIDVGEERLPPLAKLGVVDGVPVVLGSDVALVRQAVYHRLWATEIRMKDKGWGGGEGRQAAGIARGDEDRGKGEHGKVC